MAKDFSYEITEEIAVLGTSAKGWTKELNKVSYNGATPKFDLRDWAPDRESMGKGITLSEDEAKALMEALENYFYEGVIPVAGKSTIGYDENGNEVQI